MERCKECAKEAPKSKEPLTATPLPDHALCKWWDWMFELNKDHYLLSVDYFSRYSEVINLSSSTSATVVNVMKIIKFFSCHGIPEVVRSDNGPQISAKEFEKFAVSVSHM